MFQRFHLAAALLAGSVASAALAQQVDPGVPTGSAAASAPSVGMGADADYRVGPGDLLSITVYRSPDLGGSVRVGTEGTVMVPGIGPVAVAGATAGEVSARIAAQLKAGGILIDPSVNVLVAEVRANVVEVMGQVARPGGVPLDRQGITLAAVLARAGATFGSGSGVVTVLEPGGARESFLIADLVSGTRDRPAKRGEILVVQAAASVYVSGEVGHPGAFPIERGMTVGQALALGGGITPRGSKGRVTLTRKEAGGAKVFKKVAMDMPVQPDDLISVGQRIF